MTAPALGVAEPREAPDLLRSAARLVRVTALDPADTSAAAALIADEPALARVLVAAAGRRAGMQSPTDAHVRHALLRLGTGPTVSLLVSHAIAERLARRLDGYGLPAGALARHVHAVSAAVECISSVLGAEVPVEAYAAAVLHDIGMTALDGPLAASGEAARLPVHAGAADTLAGLRAEVQAVGMDHAEAGHALVRRWRLPEAVAAAVRHHHAPSDYAARTERPSAHAQRVCDLVHVADLVAVAVRPFLVGAPVELEIDAGTRRRLAITDAAFEQLCRAAIRRQPAVRARAAAGLDPRSHGPAHAA